MSYEDRAVGGAGLDVLIANTGGDRLIDWVGEFNSYLVPFAPFGIATVSRQVPPGLMDFLYALSKAQGADQTLVQDNGAATAPRNGEPYGEAGIVTQKDSGLWQDQTGGPRDPQPGNIPGGRRDVLRGADFNDAQLQGFFVDSGSWQVSGGALQVAAASLGKDASAVFYVDDYLPVYYEVAASVSTIKPTAGWNANAYIIFDYFSPTDFKYTGIDISTNKIVMGYRDAGGWHVIAQTPKQMSYGTYYQLLLSVNGTTATLTVDGATAFTYTFAARTIDGVQYALNKGMVGMGSNNARGSFDNVRVQILPPQITLDSSTDLTTGTGPLAMPVSGTWAGSSGGYTGTPTTPQDAAVVPVALPGVAGLASTSWLQLTATVRTSTSAGIAFDVYGANDAKFALLDVVGQRVLLGHVDPRRGWTVDASYAQALTAGTAYTLDVQLKGTSASVVLNGLFMVSTGFNAGVADGRFGLIAQSGSATFTALRLRTDDPQFTGSVPPPDPSALPTVTIDDVSTVEGNSGSKTVTLTVRLSQAPAVGTSVRVTWATADLTATFGEDYALSSGVLTFAAGVDTQQITVTVYGDTKIEGDETFSVQLSSPTGATLQKAVGRVTILNDDLPALSISPASVVEGASGTKTVSVTVSLSPAAVGPVTVLWATGGGTATAGSDYVAVSGTLSFAAGETSKTIDVIVNGDGLYESDETFLVTLSNPTGATLGAAAATVTIVNDDTQPTVSVTASTTSVPESGAPVVTYTVTRGGNPVGAISVVVGLTGSATRGTDYTVSGLTTSGSSLLLSLADGLTTGTFTVSVVDDTVYEGNETVVASLGACTGCAAVAPVTASLTIIDNDPVPPAVPAATISSVGVVEGAQGTTTTATFTVTLSVATTVDVTVRLQVTGGTATAGSDYTAWSPVTRDVVVRAGALSATTTLVVLGDNVREPNETVIVSVASATNATGAGNTGTLTILDDDSKLMASSSGPGAATVADADVTRVLAAAVADWRRTGRDVSQLVGVRVVVEPLADGELAQAVGRTIRLSPDAAGWGWGTDLSLVAPGRMDLLSVLVHELGHVLGLGHEDAGMGPVLAPGLRSLAVLADSSVVAGRPRAARPQEQVAVPDRVAAPAPQVTAPAGADVRGGSGPGLAVLALLLLLAFGRGLRHGGNRLHVA